MKEPVWSLKKEQICFSISRKLGDRLRQRAKEEQRSVSNLIAKILKDWLEMGR